MGYGSEVLSAYEESHAREIITTTDLKPQSTAHLAKMQGKKKEFQERKFSLDRAHCADLNLTLCAGVNMFSIQTPTQNSSRLCSQEHL